ncbi:MAG: prepilin peptidase [DPANN group archaeon]|nr:prepilin peptidase [DPANN group archaeon]
MIEIIILVTVAVLTVGSLTDLRTREVPDWLNYGLIFTAFFFRLIYALLGRDADILVQGILGFAIFAGIAYALFYLGQFGGGDAKMLMGLGMLWGFRPSWDSLMARFGVAVLATGALYGLFWSVYLAGKHKKAFLRQWSQLMDRKGVKLAKAMLILVSLIIIVLGAVMPGQTLSFSLAILALMIIITFYLWLFVKAVENSAMLKRTAPESLREGDWIAEEVKVDGTYICGPKDLGIDKEQIKTLLRLKKKSKIKEVLVKEGIPFIPSFLLAFLAVLASFSFTF